MKASLAFALAGASLATAAVTTPAAATGLHIMPPDRSVFAVGQRFDVRVEASADDAAGPPPSGLRVFLDEHEITDENALADGRGGAPAHTANYLRRGLSFDAAGDHVVRARTEDGAEAEVRLRVEAWQDAHVGAPRARNIIFFLGDGMGAAHRTAARIVSRGVSDGKARGWLAMDRLEVTGQVQTFSLNSVITDSSPGMAAYVTGAKNANNQEGVFPDNTPDFFDNPRVEYLGELLRRVRGPGFNVGIVTTADLTDSTPAANAVHTAYRYAAARIAAAYLDERETNAVSVLLGGGARQFLPKSAPGGGRQDGRNLAADFAAAGYVRLSTASELQSLLAAPQPPARLLGLFHPSHMSVAFDKVGAGRYSDELAQENYAALRDQPMLDDMTRLALRSLVAHSPAGFYLMVEGASIDKAAHDADAERSIWDVIEMDNAVAVALEFARATNTDADPDNDTLLVVTADHECGGLALVGVGNEHYSPERLGAAVRDYAAVFRFRPEPVLSFVPDYEPDAHGYPTHPDPSRKLLMGWAAAPDRYENWLSNRLYRPAAIVAGSGEPGAEGVGRPAVANPARDGAAPDSDNRSVEGRPVPGFLVPGIVENGAVACGPEQGCAGDTSSLPLTWSGHTAADVPLSASGPGAWQFTGTYDNTEVLLKLLRAASGAHAAGPPGAVKVAPAR